MNNPGMENGERYQILRPYLGVNEQLLWSGNPCTTRKYRINPFVLVFMLFWTGFAVFWTVTATSSGGVFGLFGIPFLAIGIFSLYRILFAPGKQLPLTVYAVTDTRAIILIPSKSGYNMTSYYLDSTQCVSLSDLMDNSGTIAFSHGQIAFDNRSDSTGRGNFAVPTDRFLLIDGVNEVYRLILDQTEARK